MKRNGMSGMQGLFLASLLVLNTGAVAQEKKDAPAGDKPAAGQAQGQRRAGQGDRLRQLKEQLKLTDDQVQKLKPILKDEADKLKALREDTSLTPQDRRAKAREVREAATPKIKAVLTKEQAEEWEKLRQQRQDRTQGQGGAQRQERAQRPGGGQRGQRGQRGQAPQ